MVISAFLAPLSFGEGSGVRSCEAVLFTLQGFQLAQAQKIKMIKNIHISEALLLEKQKTFKQEEGLVEEAKRLLLAERFTEKNILQHLTSYIQSFEYLDENDLDEKKIFRKEEIKNCCTYYRLKFLDSQLFHGEFPYEALLKIKDLNRLHRKDMKHFKILSTAGAFTHNDAKQGALLFAQTICGNYYLIHHWGEKIKWNRKITHFPLRNFESLFICVLLFTLLFTLITPTTMITSDTHVQQEYFNMYRIALFFHFFILTASMVVFRFFAHRLYFSSNEWDTLKIKKNN